MNKHFKHSISKHWTAVLLGISGALFVINTLIFYPGFMSQDSLDQLAQALGRTHYYDWHPPVMAWVWSIGIGITGKVASMLVFQLLIFWSALALLAIYCYKTSRSKLISGLPLLIGVLPFVSNISGVIWKDVQMAFALLLAVVLSLFLPAAKPKKWRFSLVVIILGLLIYAMLLRYNALLAVIPLVYYIAGKVFKARRQKITATLSAMILVLLCGTAINLGLSVQKSNPSSTVMLDDIINVLSPAEIDKYSSRPELSKTLKEIKDSCAEDKRVLHAYRFCSTDAQKEAVEYKFYPQLKAVWIDTLSRKPFGYIGFRIKTFVIFAFTPKQYVYIVHGGVNENQFGQHVRYKEISKGYINYIRDFARDLGFLYRPYFWLITSLGLMVFAWKKLTIYRHLVLTLSASSLLYIIGYFPVVIASDFRYIYWPVLAVCSGLLLIVLEKNQNVPKAFIIK